jgi:hypothetical protein
MLQNINASMISDPYVRVCALALQHLSFHTECPNTRLFSMLFANDLAIDEESFDEVLDSPCGNRLALIQCAIEYIQNKGECISSKNDMDYVINKINEALA